ncbi:MAG: hypothetical protein RLZZ189_840 [Pseudomonadota bacterium]|jgi:hypothetical protein
MHSRLISKLLLTWFIAFTTCLALALPSPKDIETEIQAGNFAKAESMLREVIAEKPQSAKAHYELGQVLARQERYAQAHQELVKAKDIDPTLKFASSPEKFNTVFDKVSQLHNSASAQQKSVATSPAQNSAPASSPGINWAYVFMGIAGLLALVLIIRIARPAPPASSAPPASNYSPAYPPTNPNGAAVAQRGFGQQYAPGAPQQQPYSPAPAGGMGSGIGGAVIGGLAGVAAGYALSKAMEGDHGAGNANAAPAQSGGYVPFDSPAQPDIGSFDSGSGGDSWDDGGSSGGDDSW